MNPSPDGVDSEAKKTSASRLISADPATIFDIVADPAKHHLIDGSGTVGESTFGPDRLSLGAKFGMTMNFGPLGYKMSNTVVEFVEDELIAWQHMGRHRWRFELQPVDDGTRVTESFDWSTSPVGFFLAAAGYPARHLGNIQATLERLAALVEND